ncbi:DNA cytosine methyltransferase [Candidatus Pacearchaeota archaeon]|nr:DNA cytosine methyltransferase [Candidatus Pacearchaeota archaeon]
MDITKEFRCVEWFFGYGGNHFGLKRVVPNLRLIAACEVEAYCLANLVAKMERGWLDPAPIWSDCKTFPAEPFKDRVDLFIASYPCQAESTAGKRGGEDDPRYLWPFVRAFIETARPLWVWCENVEGHLSSGFPNVYADLSDMGYRVEAGVFSALEVGASQQRKRIFFLAKLAESDSYGGGSSLRDAVYERWGTGEGGAEGLQIAARWEASFADGYLGPAGQDEALDDANGCGLSEHEGCAKAEPDSNGKDNGLSGERGQDVADNDELDGDNGRHGAGEVSQHEEAEICGCGQDVADSHGTCTSRQQHISGETETNEGGLLRSSGDDVSGEEGSLSDSISQGPQGGEQRVPLHGDGDGTEAYRPAAQFREICVAPPGEEQYFWEAPRVVDGTKGKRPVNGVDNLGKAEGDGDESRESGSPDGQGESDGYTPECSDGESGAGERRPESGLGGTADADPGGFDRLRSDGADITSLRADRLRLCGNGVDPVTASKAFFYLMRKHDESDQSQ